MKSLLKKSSSMLNLNIKAVLEFFAMIWIISIFASCFVPIVGSALSLVITFYIQQVFIKFAKIDSFEECKNDEPYFKGIFLSCLFNLLLLIPVMLVAIFNVIPFFAEFVNIIIENVFNPSKYISSFFNILKLIGGVVFLLGLTSTLLKLIFPFTTHVLLDEDFKDNSFFVNVKHSLKIASGHRFKFITVNILNLFLAFLSIFTLGLSLLYTQPLYLIMLSNLYVESKEDYVLSLKNSQEII